MPITTECPLCATKGLVPSAFSGKRVKCPKCCNLFVVTGAPTPGSASQLGNVKLSSSQMGQINLAGSQMGNQKMPGSKQGIQKPGASQPGTQRLPGSQPGTQKQPGSRPGNERTDFKRSSPPTQEIPAFNSASLNGKVASGARGRSAQVGGSSGVVLGIFALLLGLGALAICWIPEVSLYAVAMGGLGLMIGIVAMLVGLTQKRGAGLSALAALVCTGAMVVPLVSSADDTNKHAQGTNREDTAPSTDHKDDPPTSKKEVIPIVEEWVIAPTGIAKAGDVRVRVTSAEIDSVKGADAKPISPREQQLILRVVVENGSGSKKVDYKGASDATMRSGDTAARLTDNQGTPYRVAYFKDKPIQGQLAATAIAPDKSVTDVLVFDAPPADRIQYVRLELAGANFGGAGKLKVQVPRAMIVVRPPIDKELPKDKPLAQMIADLKNANPKLRADAALGLGAVGPKAASAVPDLVNLLKDQDPTVRGAVVEALGKIGPAAKTAIPQLSEALKDQFPKVRAAAAQALGSFGPDAKAELPALIVAFGDMDDEVARKAYEAVKRIEGAK